jgi:hypothetical protein
MKKFKTRVITEESQVPAGFKRICEITHSLTEQKQLSDAHTDGRIEAVKLMRSTNERGGPVWVDAAAARLVLAGDENYQHPKVVKPVVADSPAAMNHAVMSLMEMRLTLARIEAVLERLATASEAIATQPRRDDFPEFTQN